MLNTEYNSKRLNAVSSLDSAILLLYDSITSQFSGAAVNVVRGGLPGWMYSAATEASALLLTQSGCTIFMT